MQVLKQRIQQMRVAVISAMAGILAAPNAHAGFDRINTVFGTVNGWLIAGGVTVLTASILWAGYKMIWAGANFQEVSKPLIGGIVIGGAPAIAGLLLA